jgi:hypothetical protein
MIKVNYQLIFFWYFQYVKNTKKYRLRYHLKQGEETQCKYIKLKEITNCC